MIWAPTNDGDLTLLFSQTDPFAASETPSWISTTGNKDFTLNAENTYYFAFIGDNLIDLGFIFPLPTTPPSSNGLTAVETGSTNYNVFDMPTFAGGSGFGVGVGVQISALATPEPSTWVMMGLGFASLGFVGWRAQRKTTALAA